MGGGRSEVDGCAYGGTGRGGECDEGLVVTGGGGGGGGEEEEVSEIGVSYWLENTMVVGDANGHTRRFSFDTYAWLRLLCRVT